MLAGIAQSLSWNHLKAHSIQTPVGQSGWGRWGSSDIAPCLYVTFPHGPFSMAAAGQPDALHTSPLLPRDEAQGRAAPLFMA